FDDTSHESCNSWNDSTPLDDDDLNVFDMYDDSACSREISDDVQPKTIGELLREAMENPEEGKSKVIM
ncbi:hypothetical protein ACLBP3_30315, partial [Klebsiella pneumoniae]|uniref:hypothetical protein n=1 Tax=Klebsiella pneumoniae TaxID=573 RepID=UPI00396BDF45